MRLLINQVEQVQPDDRSDTLIKLFGRTAEKAAERKEITVFGFDPYFYALEDEVQDRKNELLRQESIEEIEYGDYNSIEGRDLARLYVPKPQDTRDARDLFDETWNADVLFTNRFRIDTGIRAYVEVPDELEETGVYECHWREIKPVDADVRDANPGGNTGETHLQNVSPRVVTFDIEVDDRADGFPEHGEERILSIVAHDDYDNELAAFIHAPEGRPDVEAPGEVDELFVERHENEMIREFIYWFHEKDPDLITGWNVDGFDVPYLLERIERLVGVYTNGLSPLGWAGLTSRGDPRIKGRTIYDLLEVYKKNSFTELRSYRLDNVAQEELDEEKIEFDGTFFDLYRDDPARFLEYNLRDVTLCVDINREAGVIEFRDILRREVGVDFEDSYDNKDFVDMMCRRKLKEHGVVGPTRPAYGEEPDSDYEGAHVFDAYEGVAKNVVGVDLASLYPYTMAMLNASPEAKVAGHFDGDPKTAKADNGQHFRLDKPGLFKELVDDAIALKADYKEKRDAADTDEEYEKWSEKYNVAKTLTNSIYGVTGWERFFLYDEEVAEAVTLTGQAVIKRTAEYVEDKGYEVLYGDTDSTYVKFPDDWGQEQCLAEADSLCFDLNTNVYPQLAEEHGIPAEDNLWQIEVEAHMERFFQAGKKKRYAYVATWKDGREIDNPKPTITGFSSKRSDSAQITTDTEEAVLEAILSGEEERIHDIVSEAASAIDPRDPDWEWIGIPGGMNNRLTDDPEQAASDEYYAVSCDGDNCYPQGAHPRAAWNANNVLGTDFGIDDKPMRVYLNPTYREELDRKIDVIAYETESEIKEIEDEIMIDVTRMLDTTLRSPLDLILSAMDIDVNAAVRGQRQTGLGAFSAE